MVKRYQRSYVRLIVAGWAVLMVLITIGAVQTILWIGDVIAGWWL